MPLYEYECESCGQIEECLQKMGEDPLTTCKHCSGPMHRLISQSTFHLKGSGWYVTDYKKNRSAGSQKTQKAAKSSGESNDTKTTAKPSSDSNSKK